MLLIGTPDINFRIPPNFNVEESTVDNGQARKKHDTNSIRSIFDQYMGVKADIINVNQIGKRVIKPGLIKVTLASE